MPMRMGELMVVVRAQDFASRTLRRVGGEFAAMSQAQAIAHRQDMLNIRQMKQAERIRATMGRGRALRALQTQIEMEQRLRALQTGTGPLRDPTGRFVSRQRAIEQLTNSMGTLTTQIRITDPAVERLGMRLRGMPEASQMLDAAIAGNTRRLKELGLQAGMTRREMLAFQQALRTLPVQNLDNIAHAMSGIGRTLQLFGAVGTVALGLASKTAADFSTQVSLAATQARDLTLTAKPLDQVMSQLEEGFRQGGKEIDGILDLMLRYPATADEMTAATYEIFSGMQLERKGIIDVARGLGLLETANKIAVAAGVELAEATNVMITVANNFGDSTDELATSLNTVFDIVRFGKMRLSDFNVMMNKVAPAAADAGQTLEDVGGAMAFLTTVMPSQRMVATGIARLLEAFQHPDVVKGLHMFGVEVRDAVGQLKPLHEIMTDIAKNKEFGKALQSGTLSAAEFFRIVTSRARGGGRGVFFTQEGRRVFSELIHNMDQFIIRQNQIEVNQGEFNRAFQQQIKQPGVQWAVFVNQIKALLIVIGREAIPVFVQFGQAIKGVVDWFRNLSPGTRGMIVQFAALVSIGSLLGGIFLALFGGILAFEAMLRRLVMSGAGASGMMGGLLVILQRIAAIGAIAIILQTAWSGDASAIQFILGALTGAAAGSMFGPAGAVIGGIIVPVTLLILTERPQTAMEKAFREYEEAAGGFVGKAKKFLRSKWGLGPLADALPIMPTLKSDEFEHQWRILQRTMGRRMRGFKGVFAPWLQRELKAVDPMIVKLFKKYNDGAKSSQSSVEKLLNTSKKLTLKGVREAMLKDAKAQADEMRKIYEQLTAGSDEVAQKQNEIARVTRDATNSAIESLRNMYEQMQSVNEQAFGELFQGPWLTSETFDLAKEWGITPRLQDMIRDLREQNQRFAQWRMSLDKLFKKGLPREFIEELRAIGPEEGQALVDNILKGKPGQVNNLISEWKRKNAQIKAATKMDFTQEIRQFQKAGGDMGRAIIEGFRDIGVGPWFDNWVKQTFPAVIDAAVNQAIADWKAQQPVPVVTKTPTPNADQFRRSGGGGGTQTNTDNSKRIEQTINLKSDAHDRSGREAEARKLAFMMVNAAKGIW